MSDQSTHKPRLRHNLRTCTWDGLLATPLVFLSIPGNILMAALITGVFHVEKSAYGVIVSLPFWCNALQLLVMPALGSRFSAKRITLGFAWINLVIWMALTAALPFIPRDDAETAGRILFLFFAVASAFGSLAGVGWTSWVQEWVPRRVRGKYFGFRNRLSSLATMAFLFGVGEWVGRMDDAVTGYVIVLAGAGVLRAIGLWMQHSIEGTQASRPETAPQLSLVKRFDSLRKDSAFIRFVVFGALIAFCMNAVGPFTPVFLYEHIHLSVARVTLVSIIGSLTGAVSWVIWGKVCDRHGCKPVIYLSILFWELQNLLWVILTPGRAWMLYPMFFWGGLTSTGFFLGTFNMLLKLIPPANKTLGISANLAITSLAAAIAPVGSGLILQFAQDSGWDTLLVFRLGFLLKSIAILLCLLLLRKVAEPATAGQNSIQGALRSLRHALLSAGMPIFANLSAARHGARKR